MLLPTICEAEDENIFSSPSAFWLFKASSHYSLCCPLLPWSPHSLQHQRWCLHTDNETWAQRTSQQHLGLQLHLLSVNLQGGSWELCFDQHFHRRKQETDLPSLMPLVSWVWGRTRPLCPELCPAVVEVSQPLFISSPQTAFQSVHAAASRRLEKAEGDLPMVFLEVLVQVSSRKGNGAPENTFVGSEPQEQCGPPSQARSRCLLHCSCLCSCPVPETDSTSTRKV